MTCAKVDDGNVVEATTKDGKLWTVPWNPSDYLEGLHVLRVTVEDESGEMTEKVHKFSLDGSPADLDFVGRLFLLMDLIEFFQVGLVSCKTYQFKFPSITTYTHS